MRIAEVAGATGLAIDTLRFYEKEALIQPERRNGQRVYSAGDIERLEIIRDLRALDVSIPQIRHLLDMDERIGAIARLDDASRPIIEETDRFLADTTSDLEQRIVRLQAQVDRFTHMRSKIAWLLAHGGLDDDGSMDVSRTRDDL